MLNKTFLLLFCSLSVFQASAQWHFGVQAGGNLNYIQAKNLPSKVTANRKSTVYLFSGGNVEYQFASKWSVGLDAQVAVRGYNNDAPENSEVTKATRLKYVDLVPKVSFRVVDNLDLQLGAYYSFLFEEKFKVGNSDKWISPIIDIYSKTDAGIVPGVRYQFHRLSIMANAQIGLKNILPAEFADENGQSVDVSHFNRSFQLGIGYRIF